MAARWMIAWGRKLLTTVFTAEGSVTSSTVVSADVAERPTKSRVCPTSCWACTRRARRPEAPVRRTRCSLIGGMRPAHRDGSVSHEEGANDHEPQEHSHRGAPPEEGG